MTDDDLERLLGGAFDAQARRAVPDRAAPPDPRFRHSHHRRLSARLVAPLAAAVAVAASVTIVVAVTQSSQKPREAGQLVGPSTSHSSPATSTGTSAPSSAASTAASSAASSAPTAKVSSVPAAKQVHLTTVNTVAQYGVGMPVIVRFSKRITDARTFATATKVLVNGSPVTAAWYFETTDAVASHLEAHLRMQTYWPAHSKVRVFVSAKGMSAGGGYAYSNDLSIAFATGARTLGVVNAKNDLLTVTSDGKLFGNYPVSLGASNTPTSSGVKVIMEKGTSICMRGPGYYECGIKYTQRLTYGGEYLHAAPWNMANIKMRINTSNGCTNLLPADAATLYRQLEVGDIVNYVNADGPKMSAGAGYGDWNVDWAIWLRGGLLRTS